MVSMSFKYSSSSDILLSRVSKVPLEIESSKYILPSVYRMRKFIPDIQPKTKFSQTLK